MKQDYKNDNFFRLENLLDGANSELLELDDAIEALTEVMPRMTRKQENAIKCLKQAANEIKSITSEIYGVFEELQNDDASAMEELENLENNIHPEIWEAVCGMMPGERLTFAQAYECAEAIRNCGKFDASQLRMAI